MGIKFYCPNGHKIHVKSFLAGKRGICPDCGVSVTIPTPSSSEDEDNEGNALPPPPVAGGTAAKAASGAPPVVASAPAAVRPAAVAVVPASVAPAMPQPVAVAAPVAPRAVVAAQPAVPVAGMPMPMPMPMPMAVQAAPAVKVVPVPLAVPPPPPAPPPAPPIAPGGDPIAQAPLAVWYVRPKGGEQFGPARGEIMRRWLGEGRVPADALVWREGWDDWKPAGETFPSLLGGAAVAFGAGAPPPGPAPSSKKAVDRVASRRKSQNTMAWASIIILGLITTVMLGVLVYVLTR